LSRLRQLSRHLYVYQDTCLVYLLVDGEHGLLIDCGSGSIVDQLGALGVRQIEWVLQTHHHRDQCQGASRLVARGASLAVPEQEAHFFTEAEQLWRSSRQMHNYDLSTDSFTLSQSVPVAATLGDYGSFQWRSYTVRVLPAPGHTKGSIMLLMEVDGQTVAFTGDLIAGPGTLWHLYDLQWSYGAGLGGCDGLQPAVCALADLRAATPDRLLPSHGEIMDDPSAAIDDLMANLRDLVRQLEADANGATGNSRPVGLVPDRRLVQLSDHLWMNQYSFANTYILVSDRGDALFMDCGYAAFHHFIAGFRFTEHSIRELAQRAGLKRVDLFIPSHYHDDHIAGAPFLQERYGTRIWAHEVMVDILEHPRSYALPCLLPTPIRVDRSLRDGETFEWGGFQFSIIHTPGHTRYHAALLAKVDGLRVAFTGDTLHAGSAGPMLGGPIYQNRFALGDFETSIERLRAWQPELLLTGHTGAAEVDTAWLDIATRRARESAARLRTFAPVAEDVGFSLDPSWVSIYPYQSTVSPGRYLDLTVQVRNHGPDCTAVVALDLPTAWTVAPHQAMVDIPAGSEGEACFRLGVPLDGTDDGPAVVWADVTLESGTSARHFGSVAHGLVLVTGTQQSDGHDTVGEDLILRSLVDLQSAVQTVEPGL